jgi:hypothetical protein
MVSEKLRNDKPKTVRVRANYLGHFKWDFFNKNGERMRLYDCCIPEFIPGERDGENMCLEIDLKTGKIVNWDVTKEMVKAFFDSETPDLVI